MTRTTRSQSMTVRTAPHPNKRVKRANSLNFSTPGPRWSKEDSKSSPSNKGYGDRFIPNRATMSENVLFTPTKHDKQGANMSDCKQEFRSALAKSLLNTPTGSPGKVLSFKRKTPGSEQVEQHDSALRVLYKANRAKNLLSQRVRLISTSPDRILDAPDLLDDYYLNLLHWSCNNILAVGLGTCVYLWNADTGGIDLLVEKNSSDNPITSIKWTDDGTHLAVGSTDAKVELWSVAKKTKLRTLSGHSARVSAMAFSGNILNTGGRDSTILTHDIRVGAHRIATLDTHEEEICGLSWSPDGNYLASGGNDNLACVWDKMGATGGFAPKSIFSEHKAAVKALAWCPFERNLLATGGGTADRCIRFFDTQAGQCLKTVDTKSQVCSLQWSKTEKELLSAHGFSLNQLTVWKYPTMTPIATLTGHTSRVLHTCISPDGSTVVSAAGDETLRFWNVWPSHSKKTPKSGKQGRSFLTRHIR